MPSGRRPHDDRPRFHLAIPVDDLESAERFYTSTIGCRPGRRSDRWVDLDFFDHQLVLHAVDRDDPSSTTRAHQHSNRVDGDDVPVPHFGLILAPAAWAELADRLRDAGARFVIEPHTRFRGQPGEQSTMFVLDPCGNALEFKSFADDDAVFAV